MSEDAPQFPPPDGEQETTQIPVQDGEGSVSVSGQDPSIHDNDPTHPRGNQELAEEMAYAEKPDIDHAIGYQQTVENIRQDEARSNAKAEARGDKIIWSGPANYADGLEKAADVSTQRGDRRAEAVRQDYLRDHPELAQSQSEVDENKESEATAEPIHPETLQAIKDTLLEIPADGRGNHELFYYDPGLKVGIRANYNAGDGNEGKESFGVGVYTAGELQYRMPYGNLGDYFKMREPELARAVYEASLNWSAGGRERMLQDEKDKFIQALREMGVTEAEELSQMFQKTLDLTGGNGLSSESDLHGYGWVVSGAKVEGMKALGSELGGGRQPGYMPGDKERYGVPTEQTGQALKELIQRGVSRSAEQQKAA